MINNVTDNNFELLVIKSIKPVLVDFWAEWCGPCKNLSPIIDEIGYEYKNNIFVCKIDIDKNQETCSKYNIQSIPTLIFFKKGKEICRKIGSLSKSDIIKQITELIN